MKRGGVTRNLERKSFPRLPCRRARAAAHLSRVRYTLSGSSAGRMSASVEKLSKNPDISFANGDTAVQMACFVGREDAPLEHGVRDGAPVMAGALSTEGV